MLKNIFHIHSCFHFHVLLWSILAFVLLPPFDSHFLTTQSRSNGSLLPILILLWNDFFLVCVWVQLTLAAFLFQAAAAGPGGAAAHREGVCPLPWLHSHPLPPPAGQSRHPPGPQGQAGRHLWQSRKAAWLPQPLLPPRTGGLWERTCHGGPLFPQTCQSPHCDLWLSLKYQILQLNDGGECELKVTYEWITWLIFFFFHRVSVLACMLCTARTSLSLTPWYYTVDMTSSRSVCDRPDKTTDKKRGDNLPPALVVLKGT